MKRKDQATSFGRSAGLSPALVPLVIFLSGVGGLGAESFYLKLLDFTVGSAPLVAFFTVGSFILGSGLGSWRGARVARPWKAELALFLYGALWYFGADALSRLNAAALGALAPVLGPNGAPALLAVVYAGPPAFLVGLNFPALAQLLGSGARAFALHSLGALAGLLLIEAVVFPRFGTSACLLALLAVHAASCLLLLRCRLPARPAARVAPVTVDPGLVVAGTATGGFQCAWLFVAGLVFQQKYFVPGVVVGSMILGLYLGARLWLVRKPPLAETLRWTLAGIAVSCVAVCVAMRVLPLQRLPFGLTALVGALLILPGAVPAGALFSAGVGGRRERSDFASVGFSLSLGNFLGFLAFSAIFSWFSVFWSFAVMAALLAVASQLTSSVRDVAAGRANAGNGRGLIGVATVAIAVAVVLTPEEELVRLTHPRDYAIRVEKLFRGPGELSGVFEVTAPAGAVGQPAGAVRRLYQTGRTPVALAANGEAVLGALAAAYSREHRRALVIGAGSGRTVGMVARLFERTDVVDIGSTQLPLLAYLGSYNFGLLDNPGVRFHFMDGILAPHYFRERYDAVVLTVSPAYYQLSAKLFTVEFFEKLKGMLNESGVFVSWGWSVLNAEANQVLLNTGAAVFPYQKYYCLEQCDSDPTAYYAMIYGEARPEFRPPRLAGEWVPAEVGEAFNVAEGSRLVLPHYLDSKAVHSLAQPSAALLRGD